ncbi:site-specific integrase [Roseiconus lacunae]|uniref:tyrosine-type recombinase/integrase n=1 Tax=Roseiconus lacunae TaxID=2605694 RepID=UPI00308D5150|nr:site-specific integrase [Stieleria sp. HD01]
MASVFKQTIREPLPESATITETLKAIPKGADVADGIATWVDRDKCKRSSVVEGGKVKVLTATWSNGSGDRSAPVDHTGQHVLLVDSKWQAAFKDARGKRQRRSTKTSDKAAALRIAEKWETDARKRREGVIDTSDENLAKHAATDFESHVNAFIQFRATKGGTEDHRERMRKHIEEFRVAGGWKKITDIDADDVAKHVKTLKDQGSSARTIQNRLQSIKSFSRWLANHHRLRVNPLSTISKPDPKSDRRHERRMLHPDEWPWFQQAVDSAAGVVNGMTGAERSLLYRTAVQTGLRASELASLTPGKLILQSESPHVLCKAAGTKNKKPAKQYVDTELASDLGELVKKRGKKQPVFGIVNPNELSRGLESDLAKARSLWLESLPEKEASEASESDFLTKTNHEGEHLVFHSLRHTCGAWLAIAGEHPKIVQTVMRHGTITLTMDTYGHLFPGQTEQAPVKLAAMMAGTLTPHRSPS